MSAETEKTEREALAIFERSLDLPSDSREAWIIQEARGRPELLRKALAYLSHDQSGASMLNTGGAFDDILGDETRPSHIGAYRLTETIGRGGMGAVYRGERSSGDFDHDVAIKVIRRGVISDKLVARFQSERQMLAKLSHPNIARLFDGGSLEDGAPYIVMEFIDGPPITKWANRHNLSEQDRLKLFASACDAVAFAHQNLIVHRDISPSNVLVDASGEVKLIDFGIAKLSDDQAVPANAAHSLASLTFTPGFAAPERSKGGAANTLSDIYSLGKLLEMLLDPCPVNSEAQAIIAKATSDEPEARYATVDMLRNDIENLANGFPVQAVAPSPSYRIRKFVARNKVSSAAAFAAAVGLIAAFVITLVQYQRAETALADADRRFTEVRELANFQLFDLYDELVEIPGTTKVLSQIADKSRAYLDVLADDPRASQSLQLEIAQSYKRLSDVLGNPEGANLGRREEAGVILRQAYAQLSDLHRNASGDAAITRAFAETSYALSVFEFIAEDNEEATVKYATQAATLYASLKQNGQGTGDDHRKQLSASLQAAKPLIWMGKGKEGYKAMVDLRESADALLEQRPDDRSVQVMAATIYSELAWLVSWEFPPDSPEYQETIPTINKSIGIYENILRENPDNFDVRRSLSVSYYNRALIYVGYEDDRSTLRDMRKAESLVLNLLKVDKNDRNSARILETIRKEMVMTLAYLGQASEAIALGQQVLDQKRTAHEKAPDNPGFFRDYANSLFTYGTAMKTLGMKEKSCALFRQSMAIWNTIKEDGNLAELDEQGAVKEIAGNLAAC